MMMFDAVQQARKVVRSMNVSGQISRNDQEKIHQTIQHLAHRVHPDGGGQDNGHAARVVLKSQMGRIIEEEIRNMRFRK